MRDSVGAARIGQQNITPHPGPGADRHRRMAEWGPNPLLPRLLFILLALLVWPPSAHAQTAEDPLQVGDEVRFIVSDREDLSGVRTVEPDGTLVIPGTEGIWLPAAGRSLEAVRNAVTTVLRSLYGESVEVELEIVPSSEEGVDDPAPPLPTDEPTADPVVPEQERAAPAVATEPAETRLPGFTPGGALTRGLVVPGLGQFHTRRPAVGLLILGGAGAGIFLATRSELIEERESFDAPFGPGGYQSSVSLKTYPQRELGIGLAAAALLGGALEAYTYARRQTDRGTEGRASLRVSPASSNGPASALSLGLDLRVGGVGNWLP